LALRSASLRAGLRRKACGSLTGRQHSTAYRALGVAPLNDDEEHQARDQDDVARTNVEVVRD
jgi:hypothetical protein